MSTTFNLRPSPGDPIPVTVETDQKVDGPLYGGGATVVFGGRLSLDRRWDVMAIHKR